MPRWTAQEHEQIAIIRQRLASLLAEAPPYPEVVGDRKIIRFLRGHDHNLEKVIEMYSKFLHWRKEHGVDEIRRNIVEGEADHPLKFPKGQLIMSLLPSLVMAPDAFDNFGCPIVVEQYRFSPSEVLSKVKIEEYVLFVTYSLEYRQIILEQISEQREQEFLNSLSPQERARIEDIHSKAPPYGVIAQSCVIRNLGLLLRFFILYHFSQTIKH
jgi:hypothetical protein